MEKIHDRASDASSRRTSDREPSLAEVKRLKGADGEPSIETDSFHHLAQDDYKTLFQELEKQIRNRDLDLLSPKIVSSIKLSLDHSGIAFITGPMKIGKSTCLDQVRKRFQNTYEVIEKIDAKSFPNYEAHLESREQVYFHWVKQIALQICKQQNKELTGLDNETRNRVTHQPTFISWLGSINLEDQARNPNALLSFLLLVTRLKTKLAFKKDVLISFHIDDLQTYTTREALRQIKDDIKNLPTGGREDQPFEDFETDAADDNVPRNEITVKLLVASRYLPYLMQESIICLPNFSVNEILKISSILNMEMGAGIQRKLAEDILAKTDGHPWFVFRFFRVYLRKRLMGSAAPPLQLAEEIFQDKNCWVNDTIFDRRDRSEFLKLLDSLIAGSDQLTRTEFMNFVYSPPNETSLNNGVVRVGHPLVMQSGFFKVDEDVFKNNGCFVLKNHFLKEIEDQLTS